MIGGEAFRKIWAVDFEFRAPPGHNPDPICMVAKELISGRTIRLWQEALRVTVRAPFRTGPDTLFVAYYASAEIGCHLALGWDIPANIVDLYAEFRGLTNGIPTPCGAGLLGGADGWRPLHRPPLHGHDRGRASNLGRRADPAGQPE